MSLLLEKEKVRMRISVGKTILTLTLSFSRRRNGLFIITSVIILIVLIIFSRRIGSGSPRIKNSVALIVGGALGNLYDRIVYGSVIDFLDFFAGTHHWPAFNIADSSICVGAVLLVLFNWEGKKNLGT